MAAELIRFHGTSAVAWLWRDKPAQQVGGLRGGVQNARGTGSTKAADKVLGRVWHPLPTPCPIRPIVPRPVNIGFFALQNVPNAVPSRTKTLEAVPAGGWGTMFFLRPAPERIFTVTRLQPYVHWVFWCFYGYIQRLRTVTVTS